MDSLFPHWALPALFLLVFLIGMAVCFLAAADPEGRGAPYLLPGFGCLLGAIACFGYLAFEIAAAIAGVL